MFEIKYFSSCLGMLEDRAAPGIASVRRLGAGFDRMMAQSRLGELSTDDNMETC
jgi:hypothetical protein